MYLVGRDMNYTISLLPPAWSQWLVSISAWSEERVAARLLMRIDDALEIDMARFDLGLENRCNSDGTG